MVKSTDNGSISIAPFLKKCYEMVDDESTNSIISWSKNNDNSFVIWDMTEFSVQLLPKYFKHNNFSSFIRQLNIYGFRKIDTDRWEFENDGFVRGQKHLLKNISRRKNSQGVDQRKQLQKQDNSGIPCEKNENIGLWKEVDNLKTDKNALMQELIKLRQHQETADNKLLLLKDRLQGMEKNQQQMLSFLVMAMQSPSFLVKLLKPKENNWRMAEAGTMLEHVTEEGEAVQSDGMIVRYQPQLDGTTKPVLTQVVGSENLSESDGMKDFLINADFVKVLMDENHAPLIPPELHDYGAWEQLLLASPFKDDSIEDTKLDGNPTDTGIEMESTESGEKTLNFELALQQIGKSLDLEIEPTEHGSQLGKSQNLELLTEQMGLLASDESNEELRTL